MTMFVSLFQSQPWPRHGGKKMKTQQKLNCLKMCKMDNSYFDCTATIYAMLGYTERALICLRSCCNRQESTHKHSKMTLSKSFGIAALKEFHFHRTILVLDFIHEWIRQISSLRNAHGVEVETCYKRLHGTDENKTICLPFTFFPYVQCTSYAYSSSVYLNYIHIHSFDRNYFF